MNFLVFDIVGKLVSKLLHTRFNLNVVSNKLETGREGETLAANFLVAKGYEIVARNYRYRRGEIDLIVRKDDWLLFVEVKTRSSTAYGDPETFVDLKKINRIVDAA